MSGDGPKEARQYRAEATVFLRRRPATYVVVMAMLLKPLTTFMAQEIEMSSEKWNKRQETMPLKYAGLTSGILGSRRWPLLVAAELEHENTCMDATRRLDDNGNYAWIPNPDRTLQLQTDIAKMISRAGAVVHELIITERKKMPYPLFRLLLHPEMAASLLNNPCKDRFDAYSRSYFNKFKDNLTDVEGLLELSVIVLLVKTSTILLECRNGQVQRWCTAMGAHTTRPFFRHLSATFVLSKLSRRRRMEEALFPDLARTMTSGTLPIGNGRAG